MEITFEPLSTVHFPLLLKWLEAPHVKKWWDEDIVYTMDLVKEKYESYVKGYKLFDGIHKPIDAYVIHAEKIPIGYIQIYNAYDFPRHQPLLDLPESLGALDVFIGEEKWCNQHIGSRAIEKALHQVVFPKYQYAFVAPEYKNEKAVKAYEKAGFIIVKRIDEAFWMVAHKAAVRLSIKDCIALDVAFRKSFLTGDLLWVFGSRADLAKKGGDIDLYIETHAATTDQAFDMKIQFISSLEKAIGEQKIDVVLNVLNQAHSLPIYQVALTEGLRII